MPKVGGGFGTTTIWVGVTMKEEGGEKSFDRIQLDTKDKELKK